MKEQQIGSWRLFEGPVRPESGCVSDMHQRPLRSNTTQTHTQVETFVKNLTRAFLEHEQKREQAVNVDASYRGKLEMLMTIDANGPFHGCRQKVNQHLDIYTQHPHSIFSHYHAHNKEKRCVYVVQFIVLTVCMFAFYKFPEVFVGLLVGLQTQSIHMSNKKG